jgi:hypothetical protein
MGRPEAEFFELVHRLPVHDLGGMEASAVSWIEAISALQYCFFIAIYLC